MITEVQSLKSQWSDIDFSPDPDTYIKLTDELRHGDDENVRDYSHIFDQLSAQPGEIIADIGCGTGGATRALVKSVDQLEKVIGIDKSKTMVREASRRLKDPQLPIKYLHADAHSLPIESNTLDACFATGTLEIVADPQKVFGEMTRVVRPKGRIVVNIPDMEATIIDSTNRETTRKIVHFVADHETNGWFGRQLPRILKEIDFRDIAVYPYAWIIDDFSFLQDSFFRGVTDRATAAHVISSEEAMIWIDEMRGRDHTNRFFASLINFVIAARKP
jgi:ubiquinone/menaquinone biosynthesis C-methylase UbiE